MSISAAARNVSRRSDPQNELRHDLRHIRDLVFVRELLRERGAAPTELLECDVVIDEARARLAVSARRASTCLAAAA